MREFARATAPARSGRGVPRDLQRDHRFTGVPVIDPKEQAKGGFAAAAARHRERLAQRAAERQAEAAPIASPTSPPDATDETPARARADKTTTRPPPENTPAER